ncbi:MAG: transcriptional repressor [Nitriliruptorales bacterium]|nr:transcriptional repressor [Nitriliruptorales bacterium]
MTTSERPAFRLTPQRAAVLEVVRAATDHPTARDIYRRVRARQPGIGFATVYRTLNLLVAHAEILELQLGDGAVARYDGNTGHHDHVLCEACGAVADVRVELPALACLKAEAASGFAVSGYELQFRGRCRDCSRPDQETAHAAEQAVG